MVKFLLLISGDTKRHIQNAFSASVKASKEE